MCPGILTYPEIGQKAKVHGYVHAHELSDFFRERFYQFILRSCALWAI